MSDDTKHIPFFVGKKDAKKGQIWQDIANQRLDKQHPGGHIGEGDRHAPPKYENPTLGAPLSEEETQVAVSNLEAKLKALEEQKKALPPQPKPQEEPSQIDNDDWYD